MLPNIVGKVGYFCVLAFSGKEEEAPGSLGVDSASVGEKRECPGVIESLVLVEEGLKGEAVAAGVVDFSFRGWR